MEYKISDKPNATKKDGFYMSVNFMYGDADSYENDEFGPITDETVFKLFGNFLKRIVDEQELVRTTHRMWSMRNYAGIEEQIWGDSIYEIDDLEQEDESDLDMIPEADRELYFDEEIMDKIKKVRFDHPYDANCDKLTSIDSFCATYVKDGVEYDVELIFDDSYKVPAPVDAE